MATINKCSSCKIETEDLEKGLCQVCRDIETTREELTKKLRTHVQEQNTEKDILQTIDDLTELAKETQWQQYKQVIIDTMLSEKLNHKTAWRMFVALQNIKGQSQHLQDWEKSLILLLRKEHKFSLNTIALILGRSKESVHRHAGA